METINEKNYVDVKYVTDRATFLAMKDEQKSIAIELRTGKISSERQAKRNEWLSKEPPKVEAYIRKECNLGCIHNVINPNHAAYAVAYDKWKNSAPVFEPYKYDSEYARHFNIVYSMVRGRSYKEVEPKVRENNEPSLRAVRKIISQYGLDESYFFDEKGGLK